MSIGEGFLTILKSQKMNIEQMIEKWDEQIALHRRVCEDPLMYTKEDRLKNSHYAQAICAVVADLKEVKNISSNTMLADRLPNAEDEKGDYHLAHLYEYYDGQFEWYDKDDYGLRHEVVKWTYVSAT